MYEYKIMRLMFQKSLITHVRHCVVSININININNDNKNNTIAKKQNGTMMQTGPVNHKIKT